MNGKLKTIGYWLHVANSRPAECWRDLFYAMKKEILKKYGTRIGTQAQCIKKKCWTCGGTGLFRYWGSQIGDTCNKCGGSGIYSWYWWRLEAWELGGFRFHIPIESSRTRPEGMTMPEIDGVIEHKKYPELLVWMSFGALVRLLYRKRTLAGEFRFIKRLEYDPWGDNQF